MLHRRVPSALAVMAVVAVSGCGSGDSSSSSSTPAAAADTAVSASAQRASAVTGGRTTVSMADFAFAPKALTAEAGKLRVTATNKGDSPHELVILRTDAAADALPVKGAQASEAASVGEIGEQAPGKSASHTFD